MSERTGGGPAVEVLEAARGEIRTELEPLASALAAEGMPSLAIEGQLIRPLVARAGATADHDGDGPRSGFWRSVLAIQLAHEASLVHDDVVDGATTRRGSATHAAARGVGAALVYGDHLLTAGYRVASDTGSLVFASMYARAVERTVAGEIEQGRAMRAPIGWERYREISMAKSGELLGCALAAGATIAMDPAAPSIFGLGRRLGLIYQMLDDLLDYCPSTQNAKPALSDHSHGQWTWPLMELPGDPLGEPTDEVLRSLHSSNGSASPMLRCVQRFEEEIQVWRDEAAATLGPSPILEALLTEWLDRARRAEREGRIGGRGDGRTYITPTVSPALRVRIPAPGEVTAYFARNSRSFRLAARLFPAAEAERVARVYAYCRITDDLVDRPEPGDTSGALLEEWMSHSRRAYDGDTTGIDLLDAVAAEAARAGVPFEYLSELAEGMRMDVRGQRHDTMADLRIYTYRVAGVVGLWITRLTGARDPATLHGAAALGHAMQLTNILRDVGEDLRAGRSYIPKDAMRRHGIDEDQLAACARGEGSMPDGYRALVEDLMRRAEGDYRAAFEAIPGLPRQYRRGVAAAAYVYRGIHGRIRGMGHDNLTRRAVTSLPHKALLTARALRDLWILERAGASPILTRAVILRPTTGAARDR